MLKVELSNNNILELEIPDNITGLIHPYYEGRFLADDSLSDVDVLLLSLYFLEFNRKEVGATYEEVKRLFVSLGRRDQPNFGVSFLRAKKQSLVEETQGKILRFQIKGLKHIEGILGFIGKQPVYIVKSGENLTAVKVFEQFLLNEVGGDEVLLCDSHVSHVTLFPFAVLKGKVTSVKMLTSNVYDTSKFRSYQEKLAKEMNVPIEVKESMKIHDRYFISGNNAWSIGASIKDLGNKDAIITNVSHVCESLRDLFMERWIGATAL